ncbi:MAG: ATP-binding protein [Candidatus Aminicenantes bacterium]|nr:ATP-binding protein [Candidatus Aminicenantes bacterium]
MGIVRITKYYCGSGRQRGSTLKTAFILNLSAGFLFCGFLNLFPQDTGSKYMKNYSAKEYNWHQQNWSILQDKRGCIYVGNHGALLEFDGVSWRRIVIPNMTVRSLAMDDKSGTIYIGGMNELGFLAPDPDGKGTGALRYISLLDQVEKDLQNFDVVWGAHALEDGIYFRTYNYLFRLRSGMLKAIAKTDNNRRFRYSFECGGKLYIIKTNVGLLQWVNDTLVLVPGGEIFAAQEVFMMSPYPGEKILIGSRSSGLYLYDETGGFKHFAPEAGDYLMKNGLSHGIRLRCGDYALATKSGGLIIMTSQGLVKRRYTKNLGLLEDLIRFVYEDMQCNLWLAQDEGIAKIEHASPFTLYDDRSGLARMVLAAAVYGPTGKVYAGTTGGIFYLDGTGKFQPIPGITQECRSFLSTGDSLLAATKNGVFRVDKEKPRQITGDPSYILYAPPNDEKRIWVGTDRGLVSLDRSGPPAENENPQWKPGPSFETIDREIHSIVEDRDGNLWLGTLTEGAWKVVFPGGSTLNNPVMTKYDAPGELNLKEIHVFFAAGHVMFAAANGIYRLDEKTGKLVPDLTLGKEYAGGGKGVFRIVEDAEKHIWLHSKYMNSEAVPQPDGTFSLNHRPFLRIPPAQVNMIYPGLSAGAVWFAGNDGLIRFDKTVKKEYLREFQTLIRKVIVNGELFFDGYLSETQQDSAPPAAVFKSKNRNFSIQFAAPFYEDETMTLYRTFLEGYDHQWSEPAADTRKDYTNLDPGPYTFRVQAENVYGDKGREALFRFRILPPIYKTWWAFLFYVGVVFLGMFFFVKWRSGKLQREKQQLELIVEERTKEINRKNRQLEEQTEQLKEQSEKLTEMDKVKTRFFANISHEFRTPLTLIMGPLEEMLSGLGTRENETGQKRKLGLMLRNSQRLLNLINQLLELSKIESGKMILAASLQNIIPFLKGIVSSFEPVTDKHVVALSLEFEEEEIIVNIDPGKMEDVIFNLLSNAVKFTPVGGKITVAVKRAAPGAEFPSGSATLSVLDTGPGISREQLGHIFDRFYQADSTYEHHRKGSGIGLTIARELVELHNGRIDVHSIEGKGTEFIIHLPLGAQTVQLDQTPGGAPGAAGQAIAEKIKMLEIQEEESREDSQQEPVAAETPGKNIILVVEDSADTRAYIKSSLEPAYLVVEARDGKEGIQKAGEVIPDLIVSDIMMPEIDGCELCRVLKTRIDTSHIPIILLTAKAGEEDVLEGLETGADDYITKPFNTKILCARIKNLIELRRHLQQVLDRDMMQHPVKIPASKIDKEFISRLKEVIKKNIADPDFNIEQLCEKMEMSQPTLYRKIQALTGESPTDFIRSYRLKRGARLLEEKFGSVLEVAFEVGFSSAAYFTKCFKKKFNRLPSQYHEGSKV